MSRDNINITVDQLGEAIEKELKAYSEQVTQGVNEAGLRAANNLRKRLRDTAPKRTGKWKRSLGYSKSTNNATGATTYTVGAQGKQGRLTHLLVYGHATKNGGRVRGNPFWANAVNATLPEYEQDVKNVIENKGG